MIILQAQLTPDDSTWDYKNVRIPIHQQRKVNQQLNKEKIPIKSITVTEEKGILLQIIEQPTNRVLSNDNPDNFVAMSFENFQFKDPFRNKTAQYVFNMLKAGVGINGISYHFYGHSNSQLRKKACYLLAAQSGTEAFEKINTMGDFSKIASVAKRAKRIGQLFSAAKSQIQLDEKKTLDIDDIEENGHVFTDGCGLISKNYAKQLASLSNIVFHNESYTPSVYQIRYKGYKGTLMVNPQMGSSHHVHFRDSMKKFESCPDNTFSVLDYSKPYTFGFLNGELVTLLSCLGISDDTLLRKQKEYFSLLKAALNDPQCAFIFLSYKGEHEMAEEVLCNGIAPVRSFIRRLRKTEWQGSYDKKDKERVRIMIRQSRLLLGVADYSGSLNEGEVLVRITIEGKGVRTLDGAEVIVGRNPCLHPGDIRKFKAVRKDILGHLEDCIVFPTVGKTDAPSQMSGGDLDGDTFFVSWDPDIIPEKLYDPYGYPPAKEMPRREVKQEDMIRYFANYNNASLGKVKNLYLSWAKISKDGAGSKECQELNALFSSCVDGERITVPERLKNTPEGTNDKKFILDSLCEAVQVFADNEFETDTEGIDETPEELLENLLTSERVCLKEFELFQMANRWCQKHITPLENYLHCFDFGAFTHQQKHLAIQQFESSIHKEKISRSLFNGLSSSSLLSRDELRTAYLDNKRIYWQKLYSSQDDKALRLESNVSKALELFERKFIVFRVDNSLRIGIYIPRKLLKGEELCFGKDSAKLFAFVESGNMYKTWTNQNYKLYFDGDMIQLFDKNRRNTFVWLGLQNGKFPSKNPETEFKVSIALQKFSGHLQKSRSKVTKEESKDMELYVLSNRDRVGHQILDITMSQKDTKEIVKLLNDIPKEYSLDMDFNDVPWVYSEFSEDIFLHNDFGKLANLSNICEWQQIFYLYLYRSHEKFTLAIKYVISNFHSFNLKQEIWNTIMEWIRYVPIICCLIIEALYNSESDTFPMEKHMYVSLVHAVIQTANIGKELVIALLQNLICVMARQNVKLSVKEITEMVKSIVYSVRHKNVANDLLNLIFNEENNIFEPTDIDGDQTVCFDYLKKFMLALAKDYIGEVNDKCPCDSYGIPQGAEDAEDKNDESKSRSERKSNLLDFIPKSMAQDQINEQFFGTKPVSTLKCMEVIAHEKNGMYKMNLRTDVANKIRNGDHLRFCASGRSIDEPNKRISVFDGITDSLQNGVLIFKINQPEPQELFSASWNVYICGNNTTFNAMLSAVKTLITLKTDSTTAFKSILGLPQEHAPLQSMEFKEVTIPSSKFNENQELAIQKALNNPLTLVWGPPGTGKTTVIVEILLQFLLHRQDLRILVSASTHNAVDNVLSRFISERKSRYNDGESSDIIRIASDMEKVSKKMTKWTLDAFVGANIYKNNKAMKEAEKRLEDASIVFSTCSAAGVGLLRGGKTGDDGDDTVANKKKREQTFDVVIVDEASQITEPNALIPIVKKSKFVILVGDHEQLRPTVSEIAKESGLETSLFEKLYTSKVLDPTSKKIMLNVQYRMHEKLANFPSDEFYDRKLLTGVKDEDRVIPDSRFPWPEQDGKKYPVVFVNCLGFEKYFVGSTSKLNDAQCQVTYDIIKALRQDESNKSESKPLNVTVLSPYTKQVSILRQKLVGSKVDVETVDSFQGRESDIIIYSSVVANSSHRLGFLDDARRMNVALTRAKYGLIVIGHKETLVSNGLWKKYIENYCKEVKYPK